MCPWRTRAFFSLRGRARNFPPILRVSRRRRGLCPQRARAFFLSEGEREIFRRYCGFPAEGGDCALRGHAPFFSPRESAKFSADTAAQTQEARLTPFPGTGEFRPRRASAFLAAFGGGDAPLPGRGARGGTRHLRFLIPPLATPPDLPLAAQRSFAAKNEGRN